MTNNTGLDEEAVQCGGPDTWDLGYCDDADGCVSVREDQSYTACDPTGQLDDQYQLCQNIGGDAQPDWECEAVDQSTVDPRTPYLIVYPDGELNWDLYSIQDMGLGGIAPGNCATDGCSTTDEYTEYLDGEDSYFIDPAGACFE